MRGRVRSAGVQMRGAATTSMLPHPFGAPIRQMARYRPNLEGRRGFGAYSLSFIGRGQPVSPAKGDTMNTYIQTTTREDRQHGDFDSIGA